MFTINFGQASPVPVDGLMLSTLNISVFLSDCHLSGLYVWTILLSANLLISLSTFIRDF